MSNPSDMASYGNVTAAMFQQHKFVDYLLWCEKVITIGKINEVPKCGFRKLLDAKEGLKNC